MAGGSQVAFEGQMEAVFSREKPSAKHEGTEQDFCELTNQLFLGDGVIRRPSLGTLKIHEV